MGTGAGKGSTQGKRAVEGGSRRRLLLLHHLVTGHNMRNGRDASENS